MRRLAAYWLVILAGTAGCSRQVQIPSAVLKSLQGETKLVDESNGENRFLVYGFELSPRILKEKCIVGDGLHAIIINRKRVAPAYNVWWSGASPDVLIDYSKFDVGLIVVTEMTSDPRLELHASRPEGYEGNYVPFIRTAVQIAPDGDCAIHEKLLLEPEPASNQRIRALVAETKGLLDRMDEEAEGLFDDDLGHLRNMSVSNSDAVLRAFEEIKEDKRVDGALAESLSGYFEDVERIERIETRKALDQKLFK